MSSSRTGTGSPPGAAPAEQTAGRPGDPAEEDLRREVVCWVCGNSEGNRTFLAREKMFGTGDEFDYFQCAGCGSIQIAAVPADLQRYYPPGYYSLTARPAGGLKKRLKRLRARHALGERSWLGGLLVRRYGEPPYVPWIRHTGAGFDSSILDVGSGGGSLLLDMRDAGFSDLTGVDPYVAGDLDLGGGVRVLKRTLEQVETQYELVMLNHSLEHSNDPVGLLRQVRRVLKPECHALVRVPVADCHAWQSYGTDWVQLDAPRHLLIPSEAGMNQLCGRAGLELGDIVYDSDAFQFWGSEQYRRGIPLMDPRSFSRNPRTALFRPGEIREFSTRAARLNRERRGDQACFYLFRRDH